MYKNTTLASNNAECIETLINWFIWLLAEEMPVQLGQVRKKVGEGSNPKELCSVSGVFLVKSGKPFAKPALVDICKQCVWYLLAKYLHTMIFEEGNTACLAFLACEALAGSETSNRSNFTYTRNWQSFVLILCCYKESAHCKKPGEKWKPFSSPCSTKKIEIHSSIAR